jgi:heptosyltransferase-2
LDISKALKKEPRKILVFQTAFLGDALLAIPLLKTIKIKWPQCILGIVCRRGVGEILLHGTVVDEIIEVDKSNPKSRKNAFLQTKEFKADLIISPHKSFRTTLWVARLRAKMSVGFKSPLSFFVYSKCVNRPKEKHDVLRQLSLMSLFEADNLEDEKTDLKLNIPESQRFSELSNFIVISPGSQWNTKRWTTEGFIEIGKLIEKLGKKVVIVGSPTEASLCEEISQSLSHSTNLCGQTSILELAQILKKADLLFCNDSGTMHVATTVGTPIVSIFGPTVPSQGYSPWSKFAKIVETELKCRPCGAHGHDKCPIGTHDCMKRISSNLVWNKAQELLSAEER